MGRFLVQSAYDAGLGRLLADLDHEGVMRNFEVGIDFARTFDTAGRQRIAPVEPEDLPYHFVLDRGTAKHRSELPTAEDEEEATYHLAVQFQDDVMSYLWGPVWPRCPGHPHAPDPVLVEGVATWRCPKAGKAISRIGELTFSSS